MDTPVKIDKLIRARRRIIGLQIGNDGTLIVRVPLTAGLREIHSIVQAKRAWIVRNQEKILGKNRARVPRLYAEGEYFIFIGKSYPSIYTPHSSELSFDSACFHLPSRESAALKKEFQQWYMAKAFEVIQERCGYFAGLMGLPHPKVSIGRATSRWGMCNPKGGLRFCYRLVLAPQEVIDMVVVHELAHIRVRNHSAAFYAEMAKWLPEYKKPDLWLKRHSHLLDPGILQQGGFPKV